MPNVGEIKKGTEVGYKSQSKHIWVACEVCGKYRWVPFIKAEPIYKLCCSCDSKKRIGTRGFQQIGDKHHKWKGGRTIDPMGYVKVWLSPNDFFYPMVAKSGYVLEHRLVMARHLGRCLQSWEKVHHKGIQYSDNENRGDNRIENLELTTQGSHIREHQKGYRDGYLKGLLDGHERRIKQLEARITMLEAENVILGASAGVPETLAQEAQKGGCVI